MKDASFRDILREFLEENEPESRSETPVIPSEPAFEFHWQAPSSLFRPQSTYVKTPTPESKPIIPLKVERPEPTYPVTKLSPAARQALSTLAELGADEFKSCETISEKSVKKAHRRLAKRLHPDLSGTDAPARRNEFLRLQSAYEVLERWLISEKACDSESASAEASQHRAAA